MEATRLPNGFVSGVVDGGFRQTPPHGGLDVVEQRGRDEGAADGGALRRV